MSRKARILIADDDTAVVESVSWVLEEHGYAVSAVAGAAALLELVDGGEERPPDLLLVAEMLLLVALLPPNLLLPLVAVVPPRRPRLGLLLLALALLTGTLNGFIMLCSGVASVDVGRGRSALVVGTARIHDSPCQPRAREVWCIL